MKVKLVTFPAVSGSPLVKLVHEGLNGLVQDDMMTAVFHPKDRVLAAQWEGETDWVGVITFRDAPFSKAWEVTLAYVEPSSVSSGVFQAMMRGLRGMATKEGKEHIMLSVAVTNQRADDIVRKQGGAVVYKMYNIKV